MTMKPVTGRRTLNSIDPKSTLKEFHPIIFDLPNRKRQQTGIKGGTVDFENLRKLLIAFYSESTVQTRIFDLTCVIKLLENFKIILD